MAADNAVIPQLIFFSGSSWAELNAERRRPQVMQQCSQIHRRASQNHQIFNSQFSTIHFDS